MVAAERLGVSMKDSIVVGDGTWDLLAAVRKGALGVANPVATDARNLPARFAYVRIPQTCSRTLSN